MDAHDDIVTTRAKEIPDALRDFIHGLGSAVSCSVRTTCQKRVAARTGITRAIEGQLTTLEQQVDGLAAAWPPESAQGIVATATANAVRGLATSVANLVGETLWMFARGDGDTFNARTVLLAERLTAAAGPPSAGLAEAITETVDELWHKQAEVVAAEITKMDDDMKSDATAAFSSAVKLVEAVYWRKAGEVAVNRCLVPISALTEEP